MGFNTLLTSRTAPSKSGTEQKTLQHHTEQPQESCTIDDLEG